MFYSTHNSLIFIKKGDKIPLPRNLITTFSIIPHHFLQYNTPHIIFLTSFIFLPHIITYIIIRSMPCCTLSE